MVSKSLLTNLIRQAAPASLDHLPNALLDIRSGPATSLSLSHTHTHTHTHTYECVQTINRTKPMDNPDVEMLKLTGSLNNYGELAKGSSGKVSNPHK
jgi:hypothetical protein